jgi:hypothetical protein
MQLLSQVGIALDSIGQPGHLLETRGGSALDLEV